MISPLPPPLPAAVRKIWRWMPGMLAVRIEPPAFFSEGADPTRLVGRSYRVLKVREDTVCCLLDSFPASSLSYAPDCTDPATLGCLLALVRETWGMPTGIVVSYNDDTRLWRVSWSGATHGGECGYGATEGEALIAALLRFS